MSELSGETALVTGASRGIGAAIAHELAMGGATVIGTATSTEGAAAITERFTEAGLAGEGMVLRLDDRVSLMEFLAALNARENAVSILVNSAGVTRDGLLARMKDEDWDTVIETNLSSVFRMSKACLRPMMRARRGRIVNITSIVGVIGNAGQANYAAAKAGIVGFTKSLAREVGSRGITVNAVAPGFIDTDMTRALSDEQRDALLNSIPLARLGAVDDVAKAVGFLVSQHASYITGETIHVNGGMNMA
ncbi:MAG: 3-oxoacyl-[acyl-carrier protein] reductase [Gammaproteobacteria bacterium]|jgi:3-oxoacyl-[acyl-carrier protein] reductase